MQIQGLRLIRWSYIFVVTFAASFLVTYVLRHTAWYQERLFHRLTAGSSSQQLRAAVALAQLGAEAQLLRALKAPESSVREVARRALENVWFRAAGQRAYDLAQAAYGASEREAYCEALQLLDQVTKDFPNFAEGWNRRAAVHWKLGHYEDSLRDCERTLALNPHHYFAWQGLGLCRLQLGEVEEARRCLQAALRIAPHDQTTQHCLRECEKLIESASSETGGATGRVDWL